MIIKDMPIGGIMDNGSNEKSINVSKDQIGESKKVKLFFWEKWALRPEDEKEDKISFYKVDDDPTIREVIRDLESKIIQGVATNKMRT